MADHDIIVIGASAGGVEALTTLVNALPADLPASVFIVLHIPAYGVSVLPAILSRHGNLPAVHPDDGEEFAPGRVYIAPPDHHMLLADGRIHLSRGPHENGHRPAVDTLFRSAARSYGPRVIGVILTGTLDDGTAGLQAVKMQHGLAVVQDPEDALFPGMPHSAIDNVPVDHVLPLSEIAPALTRLAREPAPEEETPAMSHEDHKQMNVETDVAGMDMAALEHPRAGKPSGYSCPECHGALWEVEEGELVRFRCRVGHAYSPDSLVASQIGALEEALWIALRALEESAALSRRLMERARGRDHDRAAVIFEEQARDAAQRAAIVRQALVYKQFQAAEADVDAPPQVSGPGAAP